eukprot:gnl/Hemi2/19738_TR6549_c0_g1_i1.p1 gnl/Hemi2/19738_TR6549_c0_g1~~gnl/Hemi2/19738_TR6549_c0_g1_i1.p1  ORF type:complete len:120 (+),score=5.36 gnl/Hemi2/19738_TR6549_c0_g1_i1:110-469(+)
MASKGISLACRDHVADKGSRGSSGHVGSDNSQPWDRADRYGVTAVDDQDRYGEILSFAFRRPEEVAAQWLICDGERNRDHRTVMFHADYLVAGVSQGPHSKTEIMTAMDLASLYRENVQ